MRHYNSCNDLLMNVSPVLQTQLVYKRVYSIGAFPLHGTARYGSLLGGFPLGTVPGT